MKESRLSHYYESEEDKAATFPLLPAFLVTAMIALGIFIGFSLKDNPTKTESPAIIPHDCQPGNFIILSKETSSITPKGFEGTITWYQTYDYEKLKSEYSDVNFHPIKNEELTDGVRLPIPDNAHAFLLSSRTNGGSYSIIYEH